MWGDEMASTIVVILVMVHHHGWYTEHSALCRRGTDTFSKYHFLCPPKLRSTCSGVTNCGIVREVE